MADLTQTAANVKINAIGPISVEQGGEALTQGMPLYVSAGKYYKCDANDTAAKAACTAIALTACTLDGYLVVAKAGASIDLGATLTVSETYILSANVGAIAPIGDLATASYSTILGHATTASNLEFRPRASGVLKP